MKGIYFFIFFIFILLVVFFLSEKGITGNIIKNHEEKTAEQVIDDLYSAIEIAKEKGDYVCCIEPACTMCYLGHWKFEKGICNCDKAIAEGRDKDVCPECKSGIEKGLCSSTIEEECELDEEIYGGK